MTPVRSRRIERLEGENRALKVEVGAVQHALMSQGPLLQFLLCYDRLDQASDPLMGRQIESGSAPHPYDRPMPHISTMRARDLERRVDRALRPLTDRMVDFFNDEHRIPHGSCLACGGEIDRSGRPPNRRSAAERFLRQNLMQPVREELIRVAAAQHGISRQTLRRAADGIVVRFEENGEWWWRLGDSDG